MGKGRDKRRRRDRKPEKRRRELIFAEKLVRSAGERLIEERRPDELRR